jgi:hypothetical protein
LPNTHQNVKIFDFYSTGIHREGKKVEAKLEPHHFAFTEQELDSRGLIILMRLRIWLW